MELLTGETGRFGREQGRFGDARADVELSPERLLGAETAIGPVFPVLTGGHFGEGLILNELALAVDLHLTARLEEERALFAKNERATARDFRDRQAERGEGRTDPAVAVVDDKFFFHESVTAARVGEDGLVVARVADVGRLHRVGLHGLGRAEVVGEVEHIDEVTTPVGEHAAACLPVGTPAARVEVFTVWQGFGEGAVPEIPVQGRGDGLGGAERAPRIDKIRAAAHPAGPNVGLDGATETI